MVANRTKEEEGRRKAIILALWIGKEGKRCGWMRANDIAKVITPYPDERNSASCAVGSIALAMARDGFLEYRWITAEVGGRNRSVRHYRLTDDGRMLAEQMWKRINAASCHRCMFSRMDQG